MNLKKLLNLGATTLFLASLSAYAGSPVFNYTDGDLILDFSLNGYSDVEVDIGSLSNLVVAAKAAGGTVQIGAYNVNTQLIGNFGGVDGVSFSVVGQQYNQSGSITAGTVYLTQPGYSQAAPPQNVPSTSQPPLQSKVLSIEGLDALGNFSVGGHGILPWSGNNSANSTNNSSTVAIIPTSGSQKANSYTVTVGASFTGAPSNPRQTLNLSTSSSIISGLFTFDPAFNDTTTPAAYDGYFTFNSNGTVYFSLPSPSSTIITSITAGGGTAVVKFNTVVGVNYSLFYTTNLNLARSSWTSNAVPAFAGTGATGTITDSTATNSARFYTVKASF